MRFRPIAETSLILLAFIATIMLPGNNWHERFALAVYVTEVVRMLIELVADFNQKRRKTTVNTLLFLDARKFRYDEGSLIDAVNYFADDDPMSLFVVKKPTQSFPTEFTTVGEGMPDGAEWPEKICALIRDKAQVCEGKAVIYVLSYEQPVLRATEALFEVPKIKRVIPQYLGNIVTAYRSRSTGPPSVGATSKVLSHPPVKPILVENPPASESDSKDRLWKTIVEGYRKAGIGAVPETRKLFCIAAKEVMSRCSSDSLYVPEFILDVQTAAIGLAQKEGYSGEKNWDGARRGMMRLMLQARALELDGDEPCLDETQAESVKVRGLHNDLELQTELWLAREALKIREILGVSEIGQLGLAIYRQGRETGLDMHELEKKARKLLRALIALEQIELVDGCYRLAPEICGDDSRTQVMNGLDVHPNTQLSQEESSSDEPVLLQ